MRKIEFGLRGEHITLDSLLKATGLAPSGGAAKTLITAGQVQVDGKPELRRGCKLRPGQRVAMAGVEVWVLTASDAVEAVAARNTGA